MSEKLLRVLLLLLLERMLFVLNHLPRGLLHLIRRNQQRLIRKRNPFAITSIHSHSKRIQA